MNIKKALILICAFLVTGTARAQFGWLGVTPAEAYGGASGQPSWNQQQGRPAGQTWGNQASQPMWQHPSEMQPSQSAAPIAPGAKETLKTGVPSEAAPGAPPAAGQQVPQTDETAQEGAPGLTAGGPVAQPQGPPLSLPATTQPSPQEVQSGAVRTVPSPQQTGASGAAGQAPAAGQIPGQQQYQGARQGQKSTNQSGHAQPGPRQRQAGPAQGQAGRRPPQ